MAMNSFDLSCGGPSVRIVARTGGVDTHGLFDFEAAESKLTAANFVCSRSTDFVRMGEDLQALPGDARIAGEAEVLLSVVQRDGQIFVDPHGARERRDSAPPRPSRPWLVVRDMPGSNAAKTAVVPAAESPSTSSFSQAPDEYAVAPATSAPLAPAAMPADAGAVPQPSDVPAATAPEGPPGGHRLMVDDTVRLGRSRFRVRQLVHEDVKGPSILPVWLGDDGNFAADPTVAGAGATCRICLNDCNSEEDPLVAPCKCRGSVEFIHLSCLRYWVQSRAGAIEMGADAQSNGSFSYRHQACELCKGNLPSTFQVGGVRQRLVELPPPKAPYIVLEGASHVQRRERGIHALSLAEGKLLKLGRGHYCDLCIQDVSISRVHATIRYHAGEFFLDDNNSKFGTLVSLRKPWHLDAGNPVSLQVGRTVFQLAVERRFESLPQRASRLANGERTQDGESSEGNEVLACDSTPSIDEAKTGVPSPMSQIA